MVVVVVAVLLGPSDPEGVLAEAGDPLERAHVQVLPVAEVEVAGDPEVAVGGAAGIALADLTGHAVLKRKEELSGEKVGYCVFFTSEFFAQKVYFFDKNRLLALFPQEFFH